MRRVSPIWSPIVCTGEKELIQENPGFAGFATDDDYRVRFAVTFNEKAEQVWLKQNDVSVRRSTS